METHLTHPPRWENIVYCDQVKQTFNRMCFFSLQKRKQAVPVKIMQQSKKMILEDEIKMLEKTVTRKDLSTSTDTQGDAEEHMMRRAVPPTVRQDKVEVG